MTEAQAQYKSKLRLFFQRIVSFLGFSETESQDKNSRFFAIFAIVPSYNYHSEVQAFWCSFAELLLITGCKVQKIELPEKTTEGHIGYIQILCEGQQIYREELRIKTEIVEKTSLLEPKPYFSILLAHGYELLPIRGFYVIP